MMKTSYDSRPQGWKNGKHHTHSVSPRPAEAQPWEARRKENGLRRKKNPHLRVTEFSDPLLLLPLPSTFSKFPFSELV